jgi:hypothetical protein
MRVTSQLTNVFVGESVYNSNRARDTAPGAPFRYPPGVNDQTMAVIPPLNPALLHSRNNLMPGFPTCMLGDADLAILRAPRLDGHWTVPALRALVRYYRISQEPPEEAMRAMFLRHFFLGGQY